MPLDVGLYIYIYIYIRVTYISVLAVLSEHKGLLEHSQVFFFSILIVQHDCIQTFQQSNNFLHFFSTIYCNERTLIGCVTLKMKSMLTLQ